MIAQAPAPPSPAGIERLPFQLEARPALKNPYSQTRAGRFYGRGGAGALSSPLPQSGISSLAPPPATRILSSPFPDPRLRAFCTAQVGAFTAVARPGDSWRADVCDVPALHAMARQRLEELLTGAQLLDDRGGRILLLRGPAGCGKTHLLRAFRRSAQRSGRGYVAHAAMTPRIVDWERWILQAVVDGLSEPHLPERGAQSSLVRIARALALSTGERSAFEELAEPVDEAETRRRVEHHLDLLLEVSSQLCLIDLDLLRALLLVPRGSAPLRARVLRYLRCEPLSDADLERLGGLAPRVAEDSPARTLRDLARIIAIVDSGSLVICLDQLEAYDLAGQDAPEKLSAALRSLCALAEHSPSIMVVAALQEDQYERMVASLPTSVRERLELDPDVLDLAPVPTPLILRRVIAARLRALYQREGVRCDPTEPYFPLQARHIDALAPLGLRAALAACRRAQEHAAETHSMPLIQLPQASDHALEGVIPDSKLDHLWTAWRAGMDRDSQSSDAEHASLMAWAMRSLIEARPGEQVHVTRKGELIEIEVQVHNGASRNLVIALCDAQPGEALAREVIRAQNHARADGLLLVRSLRFPSNPEGRDARALADVVAHGGRRVVVGEGLWRELADLRSFAANHYDQDGFEEWLAARHPLAHLSGLGSEREVDETAAEEQHELRHPDIPRPARRAPHTVQAHPPASGI